MAKGCGEAFKTARSWTFEPQQRRALIHQEQEVVKVPQGSTVVDTAQFSGLGEISRFPVHAKVRHGYCLMPESHTTLSGRRAVEAELRRKNTTMPDRGVFKTVHHKRR